MVPISKTINFRPIELIAYRSIFFFIFPSFFFLVAHFIVLFFLLFTIAFFFFLYFSGFLFLPNAIHFLNLSVFSPRLPFCPTVPLWFRTAMKRAASTGPLARPFTRTAPLTHSRTRGKVNDKLSQNGQVFHPSFFTQTVYSG